MHLYCVVSLCCVNSGSKIYNILIEGMTFKKELQPNSVSPAMSLLSKGMGSCFWFLKSSDSHASSLLPPSYLTAVSVCIGGHWSAKLTIIHWIRMSQFRTSRFESSKNSGSAKLALSESFKNPRIFISISMPSSCEQTQEAHDALLTWSKTWEHPFSQTKTEVIHLGCILTGQLATSMSMSHLLLWR